MKKVLIFITFSLLLATLNAQKITPFRGKVSDAYNFWISTPDGYSKNSTAKPLVVFLHGRSLCGRDLNRVKRYGPLNAIEKHGLKIDAIVLAPQNPGSSWRPDKVMSLVEWTKRHYNIDTNRIYVIGMSLGGYGTIDFAGTYPDRIAAAMALCGGGTLRDYCGLNDIPLWILHGTADRAVGVGASQRVVDAMHACGNSKRLIWTKLPGANHGRLARIFYLPETYQWLFAHSLSDEGRNVDRSFKINNETLSRSVYQELLKSDIIAVDYSKTAPAPSDGVETEDMYTDNETIDTLETTKTEVNDKPAPEVKAKNTNKYYTIKKGDTLSKIARKHHTSVKALCKLNNIKPDATLRIGKKIRVR